MKIVSYVAATGSDRAGFREEIVSGFLANLLARQARIARCTANVIDDALSGGLPGAKMGAETVGAGPRYDVVVEYWLDTPAADAGGLIDAILAVPGQHDAYWTEELLSFDSPAAASRAENARAARPTPA